MMGRIGSFGLKGVDSLMVLDRCNSSVLLSEAISEECERIATYERLSQSKRFGDGELSPGLPNKKKKQGWVVRVSWVFSKHGHGGQNDKIKEDAAATNSGELEEKKKQKKQKKRPSWLPDPDRRWPVQGW